MIPANQRSPNLPRDPGPVTESVEDTHLVRILEREDITVIVTTVETEEESIPDPAHVIVNITEEDLPDLHHGPLSETPEKLLSTAILDLTLVKDSELSLSSSEKYTRARL